MSEKENSNTHKTTDITKIREEEKNPDINKFSFKNSLNLFGKFVSEKLFAVPVITVFLTAILGPVAIKWVNDGFENKKLQKEVIQTMISYTNEADFSKPESIEKIAIISQMVNENKNIFGLTFDQTNDQIRQLNEAGNDVGIKNLTQKKNEYEENIKTHQAAYETDTVQLTDLQTLKENITKNLDNFKTKNNKTKTKEYQNKLALVKIELEDFEKDRDFRRKQIKYWKEQKATIEEYIEDASKDLAKMMQQNRSTQNILKQEKSELQKELAKTISEKQQMTNRIEELQNIVLSQKDSLSIFKAQTEKTKN